MKLPVPVNARSTVAGLTILNGLVFRVSFPFRTIGADAGGDDGTGVAAGVGSTLADALGVDEAGSSASGDPVVVAMLAAAPAVPSLPELHPTTTIATKTKKNRFMIHPPRCSMS
ncbi:MAG: hypothetical protein ACJ77V_06510, partial [Chloroflexota bacterium]